MTSGLWWEHGSLSERPYGWIHINYKQRGRAVENWPENKGIHWEAF